MGGAGKLAVRFELDADMTRIVMPTVRPPARTDELWRHTCFEVFVALPDSDAYCEMNFSPSGEWAMYGFVGYRRGMAPMAVRRPPRIAVRPMPRGLILEAITYLEELPMPKPDAPLRAGAAAVIEEADGRLTYWALTHPSARAGLSPSPGLRAGDRQDPGGRRRRSAAGRGTAGNVKFGIDRLLEDARLRTDLRGRRVALLAHPASVTADLTHSLDALARCQTCS